MTRMLYSHKAIMWFQKTCNLAHDLYNVYGAFIDLFWSLIVNGYKGCFSIPRTDLRSKNEQSYNFIKIKQNKTINVYFQLQEPSSIC